MAETRAARTPRPRGHGWLCIRAGLARGLHEQMRVALEQLAQPDPLCRRDDEAEDKETGAESKRTR
jgi:hypothetical protein